MDKLYYIENCGCDDTTRGLVRVSDNDFPKFKTFIENLNKNSTYGCMPRIHLYLIDECKIRPWTDEDCDSDKLYLDDMVYAIDTEYRWSIEDTPLI